ncbi:MAG TPA: ATP-binding protein [Myxococcales bacterium]|nr:ATP-binding protein [Myxococcales bacterium]
MALFKRIVPLHEAIGIIRGALAENDSGPLPEDLVELSASLRRREPARQALDEPSHPPAEAVVEAFPEAAGLIGNGCRFALANDALDAMLDGRAAGRTVLQATRSDELSEMAGRALAGWADKRELPLPAQENKLVAAVVTPLPGNRALLVLRDLTAQKRAEAMRRDFIANASHELRTPVSAISGAAETLLEMEAGEQARPFLEMISRQAARLSRLTSDLLDLSRLESGQWPLEVGAYDALQICEPVLELVKERAAAKKIHLGADVPEHLQLRCDARALEQILVNLLDNAIKYTPEQGRVTLLADAAGDKVMLSVLDSGPGIEARHQQRIFERFYRVDGGRARADGGSGLGLAIVKHLAQAQGGDVGVESGRGGSRFWVRLPAVA